MKKIICALMTAIVCVAFTLSVGATETSSEIIEETVTERVEQTVAASEVVSDVVAELESGDVDSIIGAIESAGSKAEAILTIATDLNISTQRAEEIIDKFIELGDSIAGENSGWVGFKNDVQENRHFWANLIVIGICGIFLVAVFIVVVMRVLPYLKVIKKDADNDRFANDQNRSASAKITAENNRALQDRLSSLEVLVQDLAAQLTESNICEIKQSLDKSVENSELSLKINHSTALHNLQLLYLIMGRTKLPVGNTEARNLWYSAAMQEINSMVPSHLLEKFKQDNSASGAEVKNDSGS